MRTNMGIADQIIRLILASLIILFLFTDYITGTWNVILLVLAIDLIITSAISFCPLYVPFGIKTFQEK